MKTSHFAAVGLAAWSRTEGERVGLLLCAVGILWFTRALSWSSIPVVFTLGKLLGDLPAVLFAHLVVSFPSGRLRGRLDRGVVLFCYLGYLPARILTLAFWDPTPGSHPSLNLLLVSSHPVLADAMSTAFSVYGILSTLLVLGLVIGHWYRATRFARRVQTPVVLASTVVAACLITSAILRLWELPTLVMLGLGALAVSFLVGLLRSRLDHAGVGRLVIDLGSRPAPSALRDALARTLHDPSLMLAYWLPERRGYVDSNGLPLSLPDADSDRGVVVLQSGEQPIAALVHDPGLDQDRELIEATAAAARLAIENERLQAQIRSQLDDVRRSRARIVEAADTERRRIERNLHDGAQQSLVTLSLALGLARSQLAPRGDSRLDTLLGQASEHVTAAIAELRDLARGIYPAILSEAGLAAALEALALRSAVPIHLAEMTRSRLPTAVETVAYFVVAEAIGDWAKRAPAGTISVRASLVEDDLVLELTEEGQLAPENGSAGVLSITDRVGALDGRIDVTPLPEGGVRMIVTLPCSATSPVADRARVTA